MSKIDSMVAAYIEAIYFTETGDCEQPSSNSELTPRCKAQAHIDCTNFLRAIGSSIEGPVKDFDGLDPSQLGHDL